MTGQGRAGQGRAGQRDRVAEQGDGTEQQRSTGQQSREE